ILKKWAWVHLLDEASRVVRGVAILPRYNTRGSRYLSPLGNRGGPVIPPGTWVHLLDEASRMVRGVAILTPSQHSGIPIFMTRAISFNFCTFVRKSSCYWMFCYSFYSFWKGTHTDNYIKST
ncbi:hypothetical protein L9F63_027603, partial [Diploptera punctata]